MSASNRHIRTDRRFVAALLTATVVGVACGGDSAVSDVPDDVEPAGQQVTDPAEPEPEVTYADALAEALTPLGDLARNQEKVILALARGKDQANGATAVEHVEQARAAVSSIDVPDDVGAIHAEVVAFLDAAVPIAGRLDQAATDGDTSASGAAEIEFVTAYGPVLAAARDDVEVCPIVVRSIGKAKHTSSYCPDEIPHGEWGAQVHGLSRTFALATTTAQQQRLLDLWQDGAAFRAYLLATEPHVQPANDAFIDGIRGLDTPDELVELRDAVVAFIEDNAQVGRDLIAHAEAGDSPDTMVQETLMPASEAYEAFVAGLEDGECVLFVEFEC